MHRLKLTALFLMLCGILLSGCAANEPLTEVIEIRYEIPANLLQKEPLPPLPASRQGKHVAAYIEMLEKNAQACWANIDGITRYVTSRGALSNPQ